MQFRGLIPLITSRTVIRSLRTVPDEGARYSHRRVDGAADAVGLRVADITGVLADKMRRDSELAAGAPRVTLGPGDSAAASAPGVPQ